MSLKQDLLSLLQEEDEGLSENEIASRLKLPRHLKKRVREALEELVDAGLAAKNARHRYRAKSRAKGGGADGKGIQARFVLTGSGAAFAKEEGGERDLFIPERFRGWALPGDLVLVRKLPSRGEAKRSLNDAGAVVQVLERGRQQHVGKLRREGSETFCVLKIGELELDLDVQGVPDGVEEGDWIVCGAPPLDEGGKEPGKAPYLARLGGPDTPHLDTLILIKKHNLKENFSRECLAEASRLPENPAEEDFRGRLDLREDIVFTIDGKDAKDFDDAVSIKPTREGWQLGVHIADVSHYVRPGSALDREALERATSVYLPDRVLPMLPEELSNGLCSLKPGVPRLCESAVMDFDRRGNMLRFSFAQSVIHSARRFTYDEVQAWLDKREGLSAEEAPKLGPVLLEMEKLALLRRERRDERGGLDFNFPETKVELDAKGLPVSLYRLARLFSHQLIEEFMLAANEAVAKELKAKGIGTLYRIHENPDEERLAQTLAVLARLKLGAPRGGNVTPKDLQKVLKRAEGGEWERFVHTLVLRTLRLARYAPNDEIHFGLALEDYCHFTSPIRRYPDLLVHRALRAGVLEGKSPAQVKGILGDLQQLGEHCSAMERKAEQCERDCVKAKQIRFLEGRLGQEFDATITSVTHFGFFAEIREFPAEGLVPVGLLRDGFYKFEPEWQRLEGPKGRRYSIGDAVRIRVKRADWESLQADFEVAD